MGVLLFARCMFGDPHAGTGIGAPRAARQAPSRNALGAMGLRGIVAVCS